MPKATRILVVKGGLDGHDRGVLVVAKGLADAGFEVVYGGIYASPEEIVLAALQENVDVIGVSIHSGGHQYVFQEIFDLLGRSKKDFIVVGGGIIPSQDRPLLKRLGVSVIFDPGTSVQGVIVPTLKILTGQFPKKARSAASLWRAIKGGNYYALARFISALEAGDSDALALVEKETQKHLAYRIGFSGSGGAGKSSLLARLVEHLGREHSLGVLCVDPCNISGGAFLADRIRISGAQLLQAPQTFVRSIAAREVVQGSAKGTPDILKAMEAAGKKFVLLESMGAGQRDDGFANLVQTFVYVATPAMGDTMQMLKGGLIERAHVIALNRSDMNGAQKTLDDLKFVFSRKPQSNGWLVPVIATDGLNAEGVPELWRTVLRHKGFVEGKNKNA